jgi:hypothetical protein
MRRIGMFVDQWLLPRRSIRRSSMRRLPRRLSIGHRPELEAVEGRILLSVADVPKIRATPMDVQQLGKSSVQVTEARGMGLAHDRVELRASLSSNGQPVVGQSVTFRLGLRVVGRARTDSTGEATLTNVRLSRLELKNYLAKTVVVFRGNAHLKAAVRRGPLTVGQAATTLTGVTGSGVYGGTATVSAVLRSNGAVVSGKTVSFVLDGRIVGTGTTDANGEARLSGVALTGLDAGAQGIEARFAGNSDFLEAIATGTLTIARAAVSITLDGLSQTYGDTSEVTATTSQAGVPISLSYTDASGHAIVRPVRVGTYVVTATVADGNYSGSVVGSLEIAPAILNVSGIDAMSKTYDGSTEASIDVGHVVLLGMVAGDSVAIDVSHAAASFASAGVGGSQPVAVTGLSLTGPDARNYVLAGAVASALADITPKAVTVSGMTANDKVYDGTATATVDDSGAFLVGVVAGDDVTIDGSMVSAAFADRNVGHDRAVAVSGLTLSGLAASNYTLTAPSLSADIGPRMLSLDTSAMPVFKTYDGGTTAPSPGSLVLSGVVPGELVGINMAGVTGYTMAARNVGDQVATAQGLVIDGPDAGNYAVDPTYHVAVTPALISVSGITASGKVYDGTTLALIDTSAAWLSGVVGSDHVALDASMAAGSFADKNVGTGKAILVNDLSLLGADAGNYSIQVVTGITADVTLKVVRGHGFTATDRAYDGTTGVGIGAGTIGLEPGDLVAGDEVGFDVSTLVSAAGTMADAGAGNGKTVTITGLGLTGADAGNYAVVPTTTVDIARATVTVSGVTTLSKVYDGTTDATLDTSSATLLGVIGSDAVALDALMAAGSFADKNAGSGKAVTVSGFDLVGADAANYTLVVTPVIGNIESRVLHINGFTATDRTYDGTSIVSVGAAVVSFGAGDVVVGDDVSFDVSSLASAVGTMADKNAGNGKAVTISSLSIMGTDAGNYTVVATTSVNINRATLTVTGIPNLSKSYDGNQYFVSINTSGAAVSGAIGADVVTLNTAGVFGVSTSANVGTWSVFINGLSLSGTEAGNYNLGTVIVSGTIVGP